jgi:hypothetical protein
MIYIPPRLSFPAPAPHGVLAVVDSGRDRTTRGGCAQSPLQGGGSAGFPAELTAPAYVGDATGTFDALPGRRFFDAHEPEADDNQRAAEDIAAT